MLTDRDFLAAFHNCTLPNSAFHHRDHLRLAWIHLHTQPFDEALAAVRDGIRRFAAHNGTPNLYNETITTAWVKLLSTHHEATFAEFIERNQHRLGKNLLHRFWSPALLESDAARLAWVSPDREALPVQPVVEV